MCDFSQLNTGQSTRIQLLIILLFLMRSICEIAIASELGRADNDADVAKMIMARAIGGMIGIFLSIVLGIWLFLVIKKTHAWVVAKNAYERRVERGEFGTWIMYKNAY